LPQADAHRPLIVGGLDGSQSPHLRGLPIIFLFYANEGQALL
jgi:hypothetical protein